MKRLVLWSAIAILLVIGLLVLLSGSALTSRFSSVGTSPESDAPSGSLFISSVTDSGFLFLDAYILDLDAHTLSIAEPDQESQTSMYTLSPNGVAVTFLGTTKPLVNNLVAKKVAGDPMQVYRAPFNATAATLPAISQAEVLTNDTSVQKSVPVISNDGRSILYVETPIEKATSSDMSIDGRTIRLISDFSRNKVAVAGMYPQWYSTNHFYYIAKDGVRLHNIEKNLSELVLPITTQSNFKLAVSHDGRKLAFTNPDAGNIYIYDITSQGVQLTLTSTIKMKGYWVVFSPDDRFMAVQTDTNGTPELVIYDSRNFTPVGQPITLSPLLNSRLFVTAWTR